MKRHLTLLFVAVAFAIGSIGTATAAGLITGKQIKDKSLQANDLLVRVATAQTDNNASNQVSGTSTLLKVKVNAPTKGYLVVTASSDVYAPTNPDYGNCWIQLGDKYALGSERSIHLDASFNDEEDCNTNVVIPVAAGTRTVKFMSSQSGNLVFDETTLSAEFVPFNGQGKRPTGAEISGAVVVAKPVLKHSGN